MSTIKSKFCKLFFAAFCLCFVFTLTAYSEAQTAQEKLDLGKQFYNEGKYNQAMDNFIDVFVQGNSDQIAQANEYVNMIHFSMGGVAAPKQIPYDAALEAKKEADHKGKELVGLKGKTDEYGEPVVAQPAAPTTPAAAKEPFIYQVTEGDQAKVKEQIVVEDTLPEGDPEKLKELRKEQIDAEIASMSSSIIARLQKINGVNVYLRGGLIDAIDIDSDVIFKNDKITFNPDSKTVLDDVYALMILSGTPSFVLLPPGSYTDEVSIQGVRQAVALNSYLINMGVSSAKLNFNMGLTTDQPPAKFSNLEGISIVFDYTAKPNLKLKLGEKNVPPVVSLGMYPFESITPEDNQGMLVDFSVIEASSSISNWKLQIVQHAKDGKYYVVRQISGKDPVYKQIFWNGRKQYFGQILPLGRYTLILKAEDSQGREKIVRRKVELLGKESKDAAVKQAKPKAAVKEKILDYSSPRLWAKPNRVAKEGASEVQEADYSAPAAMVQSSMPADTYMEQDPLLSGQNAGAYNPAAAAPANAGYDAQTGTAYDSVNMPYPSQQPAEDGATVPDSAADYNY